MSNRIDAILEEHNINGKMEHKLYFHYNGVEFTFLYKAEEAEVFASEFKWKYLITNTSADNHRFTDNKGYTMDKRYYYSVLSSINGIEEIDDSIVNLISTCCNLDIQSDLTFHYNDKEYPLVRSVDHKEYHPSDKQQISKKGFSIKQLKELTKDIIEIKKNQNKQKKVY